MENQEVKYKYFCETCKYGAKTNMEWIKHTSTQKHQRGGLKNKICEICNHECFNNWNLKQHYLFNHATPEEKEQHKYFCKDCDKIFLSQSYYDQHMNGIKHKTRIKCLEILNKMNEEKTNKIN